jgi:hypothetical protein
VVDRRGGGVVAGAVRGVVDFRVGKLFVVSTGPRSRVGEILITSSRDAAIVTVLSGRPSNVLALNVCVARSIGTHRAHDNDTSVTTNRRPVSPPVLMTITSPGSR